MKIDQYITGLRKNNNIIVTVDNGDVKIRAEQEALTKEIVEDIRSRKTEIIDFFHSIKRNTEMIAFPRALSKPWYNISSAQKRLYFLHEMDKTSQAYNLPYIVQLDGHLDKDRLNQAFQQLIARHEALRTYFDLVDGYPVQKIAGATSFTIEYYTTEKKDIPALIRKFICPFDLTRAPLMRVGLASISATEYILMIDMHHIVTDGISQGVLIKDFISLYNKEELPVLTLHYKDYAVWQQSEKQQAQIARQKDFWLREFAEETMFLDLPVDFVRPSVKRDEGTFFEFALSVNDTDRLKAIASREGATLFMVLLSAYTILLGKLGNQEDVVVGTSSAGREHADLEMVIGMFINMVTLRNYPKGELSFTEFLSSVRSKTVACFENQAFQYDQLVDELNVERNTSRNPLFDATFEFQNFETTAFEVPGLTLTPYEQLNTSSKFDLTLTAGEQDRKIRLNFNYSTALFKEETIAKFASYFTKIIAAIIENPSIKISDIEIIPGDERRLLLHEFNNTYTDYPRHETVISLFEQQAAITPGNIALECAGERLTYRELKESSDKIAAWLFQTYALKAGDLAGIMLDREQLLIPVILGILKTGAAYVPIDPEYPAERVNSIIEDSRLKVLVTREKHLHSSLHTAASVVDLDKVADTILSLSSNIVLPALSGDQLVYVIYTSGSTGKPKGVMIEHRSLVNYISWAAQQYVRGDRAVFPLYTSISFDLTVTSIFTPLLTGNKIIVYGEDEKGAVIEKIIANEEINVIKLTPSHLKVIRNSLAAKIQVNNTKRLIVGGEQLDTQLAKDIFEKLQGHVEIYNEYGPTEATVGCMIHRFSPEEVLPAVPIGIPSANTYIYILDRFLKPVPAGVPGELYISGDGVARGYLLNEQLTNQKFTGNPFVEGERMYKTGDLAVMQPNGTIVFKGRIDEQVKIRGFRIEPGEIEVQLASHPLIREAAVIVKEKEGNNYLAAYYVSETTIKEKEIREFLSGKLPDYMIPSFFVALDKFPLTPNGKLDRKRLPDPVMESMLEYVAPQSKEELLLAEVWSQVLGIKKPGVTDNFFSLGGDSIKSIQIISRLQTAGYELSVKDIFTTQTIRELSLRMKQTTVLADQSLITGNSALTPIQRWFFEGAIVNKGHYNQSVMLEFPEGISRQTVEKIFAKLQEHHDALRMVFKAGQDVMIAETKGLELPVWIEEYELPEKNTKQEFFLSTCNKIQSGINLSTGPLMRLGLFNGEKSSRLLIVVHHLVMDGISWRILFEDIERLYEQVQKQEPLTLPFKTDSFQSWAGHLSEYTKTSIFEKAKAYWDDQSSGKIISLQRDYANNDQAVKASNVESIQLSKEATTALLSDVHFPFTTQINDILLTALLLGISKQYGLQEIQIDLEGHGREDIGQKVNISRTIGWFTSIYPVRLTKGNGELSATIKKVKELLRSVPNHGIDYLLQKYGGDKVTEINQSPICFNYLGQFDADTAGKTFSIAKESKGDEQSPDEINQYDWDIAGMITGGRLGISLRYSDQQHKKETIQSFLDLYSESLQEIIRYCKAYGKKELTPSDITFKNLPAPQLEELQQRYELADVYPLSPMQEGLLFHSLLDAGAGHFFEQMTYRVNGKLDIPAVERTMNDLIARYDVLRTVFLHEGLERPLQVVLKERKIVFRYEDIREKTLHDSVKETVEACREKDKAQGFDLGKDVLIRLHILRTGAEEYEFIWSHHHVVMDGWCMSIIINDFKKLYAANCAGLLAKLPPVNPYSTYITWLENREKQQSINYWREYLAAYASLATLPRKTSLTGKVAYQGASHELIVDGASTKQLKLFSREQGITLNTILQVCWGILLGKYNNSNDVVFGAVVSGRPPEIEGIENMVGLFINTVPVRITCRETDKISDLMTIVQETALAGEEHHYHSLPGIQSLSLLGRDLFDHILVFENFPLADEIAGAGLLNNPADFTVSHVDVHEQTNYDLALIISPGEEIRVRLSYNAAVYDRETIERLSEHFYNSIKQVVSNATAQVAGIEIMTEEEKQQIIKDFNDTQVDLAPGNTVIGLFEEQVKRTPGNIALKFGEHTLSYKQFNEQANRIAFYLKEIKKVEQGDLVGLMLERDEYLVLSVFGILKAGAAYIPIDPAYPAERVASIINDSGLKVLLTRAGHEHKLTPGNYRVVNLDTLPGKLNALPPLNPGVQVTTTDLAYIIYTSGSTGKPKGVMIEHGSVINLIQHMQSRYPLGSKDSYLFKTSYNFDVSVAELFGWFYEGGSLTVLPAGSEADPIAILDTIEKNGVTHMNFVPSMFAAFTQELETPGIQKINGLKHIFLAGEALPAEMVRRFNALNSGISLENIYGPTEATIYSCEYSTAKIIDDIKIPIGKPISNVRLYIVDSSGKLQPIGITGELCIAGKGLARGYLNNRQLTAEKFIYNSFIGERVYKTGDLVRWLPDGNIEYIGRMDHQVKIRGFRVELGEIESQLARHDHIRETVVLAREKEGSKYLVAYYSADKEIIVAGLKSFLSERLPDYMVPLYFVHLHQLPVTSNGKLDRNALPDPEMNAGNEYVRAGTNEEKLLVDIWSKVLGVAGIGITDDFFSVGGDSIKSILISSGMRNAGYDLPVKDIFSNQTIQQLAKKLKKLTIVSDQSAVSGKSSLTPVQQWFFEGAITRKHHFNQSVLLDFPGGITEDVVRKIFGKLEEHHDALRMVFREENGQIIAETRKSTAGISLQVYNWREEKNTGEQFVSACNEIQSGIDLAKGPLMKLGLFHTDKGSRLLIVIHHLVIDGISWRILFEDIENLYQQTRNEQPLTLPLKTDSFQSWPARLQEYTKTKTFEKAKQYWQHFSNSGFASVTRDFPEGSNTRRNELSRQFQLSKEDTTRLLTAAHSSFNTQINDLLLCALLVSVKKQFGNESLAIDFESHGREQLQSGTNITRTVGWFTSIYPVLLQSNKSTLAGMIKQVKEIVRNVPNHGIDYLLLKYSGATDSLPKENTARILFNYLGQFDTDISNHTYTVAREAAGDEVSPDENRGYDWNLSGIITGAQLNMRISYSSEQYKEESMAGLMAAWKISLLEIIGYCCGYEKTELSPSDLTYKELPADQLDALQQAYELEDVYSLSPMQEGMLFHSILDGGSGNYFGQTTCRLKGNLDIKAIEQSMNDLVARYTILRTIFLHEGFDRRIQVVLKERKINFTYYDMREACLSDSKENILHSYCLQDKANAFDLSKDVLMRLAVLQTANDEYELIWSHHHVLMDGWCMGIIVNEFRKIYQHYTTGTELSLPAVIPYSQYIEWLEKRDKDDSVHYWTNYLSGYDNLATLPQKETVSKAGAAYVQKAYNMVLSREQTKLLHKVSRSSGVTINTILQCAWGLLLGKYNNSNDVVFGSVVSGRPAQIAGIETMAGLFINTIPVRVNYESDDTVTSLWKKVQDFLLESEDHHYHPLFEIQSLSGPGRDLLDHIMVFENFPLSRQIENENASAGFEVTDVKYLVQTDYDFNIMLLPFDEFEVQFDYNENKYDRSTIEDIATCYRNIILALVNNPGLPVKDISVLGEQELAATQEKFSIDLKNGLIDETIQSRLDRSFKKHSKLTAVEYNGRSVSYAAIETKAKKIAAAITMQQIPRGSYIGIFCEDREWVICSLTGILKANAVFVPLETTLPEPRLLSMISQVDCRYIITDQPAERCSSINETHQGITWLTIDEIAQLDENSFRENGHPDPEDPVYVYFTSGSTGNPKGVLGKNKGLSHFVQWEINAFGIDSHFRFSQFTNPGFDVFMRDIIVPLCAGATICIPGEETLSTGPGINQWIDAQKINLIHCVPSFFKLFTKDIIVKDQFPALKFILLAGEKILPYELKNWYNIFDQRIQLVNVYGPTETTLAKGYYLIRPDHCEKKYIPVKAIPGAQFLILDNQLNVCPQRAIGEIYVRTPYRTAGYLNATEINKQSFIINPFSGDSDDLIYKTGDLGRQHEEGEIEILGRLDSQVKIRGIRIELDDIKENILRYPGIEEAVLVTRQDSESEKFICAYIITKEPIDETDLRNYLGRVLPRNMVPSHIIRLERFPLMPNGKINRKALPEPALVKTDDNGPANKFERKLLDIWAEILKVDREVISLTKSFFEMGGHSIKVFNLINRVQQEFSIKLKLGDIFQHTSVKKLSALIAGLKVDVNTQIPRVEEKQYYEASPAQERMYYQHMLHQEDVVFNISIPVRIKGIPDIEKIEQTFRVLIDRHESLRTAFVLTDTGVAQQIQQKIDFRLELINPANYNTVEDAFRNFIRPFDLATAPLMRCGLLQRGENDNFLFVDIHHIIADGTSVNVLINEFNKIYEGKSLMQPELRYVDYAAWINQTKGSLETQKQYWLDKLSGELSYLNLPVNEEGTGADGHLAAVKILRIKGEEYRDIKEYAAAADVSDYMFLLSVCYILLSKISGSQDIIVCTDVIGRTQPVLKDMVGTFVNILPLRMQVKPGMIYSLLLQNVKECVAEAFDNQDFQFDQLVALTGHARDKSSSPLAQVHFSFSNTLDSDAGLNEFEIYPIESIRNETSEYPFKIEIRERDGQLDVAFIYNRALYDEETIRLLSGYYHTILLAVLQNNSTRIASIDMERSLQYSE